MYSDLQVQQEYYIQATLSTVLTIEQPTPVSECKYGTRLCVPIKREDRFICIEKIIKCHNLFLKHQYKKINIFLEVQEIT